jgi:hypothetical protein
MPEKPSWINLKSSQRDELDRLVRPPGWCLVSRSDLPSIFPHSLREKIDSALMIAAPTSTGGTYLAFSANRVDSKARAIDVEPFGVIVHSTGLRAKATSTPPAPSRPRPHAPSPGHHAPSPVRRPPAGAAGTEPSGPRLRAVPGTGPRVSAGRVRGLPGYKS